MVGLAGLALVDLLRPATPQVGNWRSAEGRADYQSAYRDVLEQLPQPATTTDVETSYGTVRLYEWSSPGTVDEPPVVLIPGRTSGAPMWRDNLPSVLGKHRVIALDPLGDAGLSVQAVPISSAADQSAWLDDVFDAVSPGADVHLVGHSFGGATAAAYALAHPDRVASLTLLEPVFTLAGPPVSIYLWSALILLPTPRTWRDEALRRIGGTVDDAQTDIQDPLAQMIDIGAREYSAKLPTPSVLSDDELAALTMPVYVAIGGQESLAGGAEAARRARSMDDATVTVWPRTTHSLPFQVPEELGAALVGFWEAASPAR